MNCNSILKSLLLALVFTIGWGTAFADTWDGTKSSSLSTKEGGTGAAGSATNPYLIQSAKDFAYLMIDKAGQSWYVELTADLDMDGANRTWTGGQNKTYKGHFDGGGHTISNVRVAFSAGGNYGVFGGKLEGASSSNKAEVKNINLDNITLECTSIASFSYNGQTGAVAGQAKWAVIDHVTATDIKATYKANVGITGNNTIGGLIGYATDIVDVTNCTVDGYEITIQGATTKLYLGGLIGQTNNTGTNSSINVIGNTVKGVDITLNGATDSPYIGGFIGYVNSAPNSPLGTPAKIYKNRVEKSTTASSKGYYNKSVSITMNGDVKTNTYVGGFLGYALGKTSPTYRAQIKANTVEDVKLSILGNVTTATLYAGGFMGRVGQHCDVLNNKVKNPHVSVTGKITVAANIGGAIGYSSDYSIIDGLHIDGGSIIGPTETKTIANNVIVSFGGVLANKAASANTANYQVAVFKNVAIKNFNIDLGNYTSADGKIQNWKFFVGGVIGTLGDSRIGKEGTTSSMPENLVSKSVKIYAPLAVVAPFVANFANAAVSYESYFMQKTTTLDDVEKSKVGTWVYNDFKVGLSSSVKSHTNLVDYGTASGAGKYQRNYTSADAQTETSAAGIASGVSYISVDKLKNTNRMGDFETDSKTVLWWTTQDGSATSPNNDVDQNIFPSTGATSTGNLPNGSNAGTYSYWMYYYQGVNYGTLLEEAQLTPVINGIDANVAKAKESEAPVTLTITDAQDKARGFDAHNLTVTPSDGGSYTYTWYINGKVATAGNDGVLSVSNNTLSVKPDWKYGKSIFVTSPLGESEGAVSTGFTLKHGVLHTKTSYDLRTSEPQDLSTDYVGMSYTDRGTEANPYIIDSPEALRQWSYLSTYPNGWCFEGLVANGKTGLHWNRAWFELSEDINLNNEEFTPISHASRNNKINTLYNQNYVFCGHFDGKGYTIRNFKVTWRGGQYNADGNQYFGLFGAVGWGAQSTTETCVIQNLVIDNAQFVHDTGNTSFAYNNGQTTSKNNLYIGALAGIVSNRTTIQNIEVRNSKITDAGSSAYNLQGKIFSVGGMIGRVQTTAVSTSVGDLANNASLKFLSSDCDIELTHAEYLNNTSNSQMRYFNIGGVVGSLKTSSAFATINMPQYAYYNGKINSPNAIVGPVFASVDYSGNTSDTYSDYWKHYMAKTSEAAQEIPNLYYGDYKIQDYSESISVERTITDSYPEYTCYYGSRTITPHNSTHQNNNTFYTGDNYYGEYQGVNYGEYINTGGQKTQLEVEIEKAMIDEGIEGYYLIFDGNQMQLVKSKPMKVSILDNTTDAAATTHTLKVVNNKGDKGYSYAWYSNGKQVSTEATYNAPIGTSPQLIYVEATETATSTTKNTEAIALPRSITDLSASYSPDRKKEVTTATVDFVVTPKYMISEDNQYDEGHSIPAGYTATYKWEQFTKGSVSEETYTETTALEANKPHIISITNGSGQAVDKSQWTYEMSIGTASGYTVTYEKTLSTFEETITTEQYSALSDTEKAKCTSNGDGTYTYTHDVEVTYTPVKSGDKYQSSTSDSWNTLSNTAASLAGADKNKTYRCTITATDGNWNTFVTGLTDSSSPYYVLRNAYPTTFTYEMVVRLRDRKVVYLHPVNSDNSANDGVPVGSDTWTGVSKDQLGDKNHPVATWGKAYSLLDGDEGATWDDNIIVLVGKSDYQTTWGTGKISDRTGGVSGYFSNISHYGLSNVFVRSNNDEVYGDNEVDHPKYETYKAMIEQSPMGKNVTITGKWYKDDDETKELVDYNAMIESPQYGGRKGREFINFYGNTKIEHLTFWGYSGDYDGLFAHYHDLWFGEGLIMKNYVASTSDYGTIATISTPRMQVFGGMTGDSRFNQYYDAVGGLMDGKIVESMPNGEKGFTITVRSGYYSIICSGSRQTSNVGLQGSPNRPIKCTIDVDIDQEWNLKDGHDFTMKTTTASTPYDIALIMAGNHEGAMYADVDINVKSGRVARIVNGSLGAIRQNTFKYNGTSQNYPLNTYMGRANILLDPASSRFATQGETKETTNKRVLVTELYNGGVGRSLGSNGEIDMPSLGKNTCTIKGGTIGYPEETTNWKGLATMKNSDQIFPGIYGGGAGGMNGIGYGAAEAASHTKEPRLPYWTDINKNTVLYGDYSKFKEENAKNKFTITCYNTDTKDYTYIDPLETSSEINIEGGVLGTKEAPINVFGGGSGFTSTWFLKNTSTSYPCTQAGCMFGSSKDAVVTTVNIKGNAVIYGNIYGAGKGTDYYYTNYRSGSTPWGENKDQATKYTALGQTYGSVVTNISGNAIINGNVYGAGAGVADARFVDGSKYTALTETALLSGNSTVNISGDAQVKSYEVTTGTGSSAKTTTYGGNVYGGGMLAKVGGNTTVNISGTAQIEGNVFGAAQGITNKTSTSKQYISKTTETYLLNTADNAKLFGIVKGNTTLKINNQVIIGGVVTTTATKPIIGGDIYGGAESAITEGSTNVTVNGAYINNVYGGGLGSLASSTIGAASADVYGDTKVQVINAQYSNNDNTDHYIYGGGNFASIIGKTVDETKSGGSTTVIVNTGIACDQTTVFGAGYGAATRCDYTNVTINSFPANTSTSLSTGSQGDNTIYGLSAVYGGGNQGTVTTKATVNIKGGRIFGKLFGGGNEATVGTALTAKGASESAEDYSARINEWAENNGTAITINNKEANIYDDIFGGGNLASVYGNTAINLYAGNFGGSIYGGGNGKLNNGNVTTSADITGNTSIYIAQDKGGQETETDEETNEEVKFDNFSINVIWDKAWNPSTKSFSTWSANKNDFWDATNKKFLNPHNIYGGGNAACIVGTYGAPESNALAIDKKPTPGTGQTTVTVLKGMTPVALLSTKEWKDAYNDNKNPHFYVFGGGYGKNTKVGSTDVTVNVDGEYGEYTNEITEKVDDDDNNANEQLAPIRGASPGDTKTAPVFDNTKGIPNFTVLGVLGGGYAGLVTNDTKVTVDGKTFLHRVYGGGFGDPAATSADDITGQVGGNTEVIVQGAHTYGDVFGGGAGVVSTSTTFDKVARVLGNTSVTVQDDANIYGAVYGGGDMACVGVAPGDSETRATRYSSAPTSSSISSAGAIQAYDHNNHTSFVNILGGNIFGEVYGGGKGVLKADAKDYTKVGRIDGNTLVHIANVTETNEENQFVPTIVNQPYVWNRIYGGCAYGTVDGNTMVHVEGGMLGLNIFGGGYGDIPLTNDQTGQNAGASTASSTLDQILGKADTEQKGTYANILGNTKVQIDGGSWIWNRKADINGNITTWKNAGLKLANNASEAQALMANIKAAAALEDKTEAYKTILSLTKISADDAEFFDLSSLTFKKNHNIFGGGNRACLVGTYSDNKSWTDAAPTANTGKTEVVINHSPLTKIPSGSNDPDLTLQDATILAGMCWYLSTNNIAHPQFSVFGAGYGANTKVGTTDVRIQPGSQLSSSGGFLKMNGYSPKLKYINELSDIMTFFEFENELSEPWDDLTDDYCREHYGAGTTDTEGNPLTKDSDFKTFLRFRAAQLAWSLGAPNTTFMDIHGGGYSGYVQGDTKVTTDCQLACRNVFGAGLGATPYETPENQEAADALTFGSIGGNATVLLKSGTVSLNVYGGGAGVESISLSTGEGQGGSFIDFPNIARVKGATDVKVYGEMYTMPETVASYMPERLAGKSFERVLVFGSVYGGGDVANVGPSDYTLTKQNITNVTKNGDNWEVTWSSEPTFTTTVGIYGASILSQAYAGGNGRYASECNDYTKLGAVYGNTCFILDAADDTYPYESDTKKKPSGVVKPYMWNRIYGGCQNGTVYGNTFVHIKDGWVSHNIFGGGWGNVSTDLVGGQTITSADVTGNTNILITGGEHKMSSYWDYEKRAWQPAKYYANQWYSPQYDPEKKKFLINHNIYGGGNAACQVKGDSYVTMTKGMLFRTTTVLPGSNTVSSSYSFFNSNEWKEVYNKVGSPHFCVFGGGFGENTVVANTHVNVNLEGGHDIASIPERKTGEEYKHFLDKQSVMDIVGGGYNGKITGETTVNVDNGTFARRVFGGGFYNSVNSSNVNIKAIDCTDVFGGGLMGDVLTSTNVNIGSDETGADNRNIYIHGNIYGANDVSGYVNMSLNDEGYFLQNNPDGGTNITIKGGKIFGNVYGGGNGNYLYALDSEGHDKVTVNEYYQIDKTDVNSRKFDLVYTVPMRSTMPSYKAASDAAKIVNINSWRPLSNRVNIKIAGQSSDDAVTIDGDVYGGGNSATVLKVFTDYSSTDKAGDVTMDIGSYTTIGRVFMGCNGDELFTETEDKSFLADFQTLNNLKLYNEIDWENDPSNHGISTLYLPTENKDRPRVYPHLLDLYFYPVEMNIQGALKWAGSAEGPGLTNCTIGTFCCGGNRGNMDIYPSTEDEKKGNVVDYIFPAGLTIKDAIIGGCNNANFDRYYEEIQSSISHEGGYLLGEGHSDHPYIKLTVKNQFDPASDGTKGYLAGNVFGGCYETGTVRGDVTIDFHSDMLSGKSKETLQKSYDTATPALSVYGAGFGEDSYVYGDVNVLFGQGESITADPTVESGNYQSHGTSAHFVYGGGQKGNVIGLTNVDIFNGHVAKAVTGGSYSGYVWGSTQVKVGYPTYYKLKAGNSGRYLIKRTDVNNEDKKNKDKEGNETSAIKQYVCLLSGDIVSPAVYKAIYAKYNGEGVEATTITDKNTYFDAVEAPTPSVGWDNIRINIDEAIYGGGYSVVSGSSVKANNTTVLKLTDKYNIDDIYRSGNLSELTGGVRTGTSAGFAGNTTVLVADATSQASGATDRDHITVSHQEMKVANVAAGTDLYGYYYMGTDGNYHYIYQAGTYKKGLKMPQDAKKTSGETPDYTVYQYDSEGGIFGDGHLSYAEGFRNADVRGYGYAGSTVKNPKRINTLQRFDIVRLTDNCFTLLGARDYTVNEISTTPYSISRVGEVQMYSSIKGDETILATSGERARNFLGFSNNIHYIGAVYSDVDFKTAKWHNASGALGSSSDKLGKEDVGGLDGLSYQAVKEKYIDDYYTDGYKTTDPEKLPNFEYRNDGTAKNMIGIASGYALKIQNVQESYDDNKLKETIFYGPIYGVVEVNLIDVQEDEGGGYVYADNIHRRPAGDKARKTDPSVASLPLDDSQHPNDVNKANLRMTGETESEYSEYEDFLETTGNFVFPYNAAEGRHVVDDCFPAGYDSRFSSDGTVKTAEQNAEIHYWYVTGYNYFYHAHITGYTYNSSTAALPFDMNNADGLMKFSGAKAGQTPEIYSITWRSGHQSDYHCDLEERNADGSTAVDASGNQIVTGNETDGYTHGYVLGISEAEGINQKYSEGTAHYNQLFGGLVHNDESKKEMTGKLSADNASIAMRLMDKVDNSGTVYNGTDDYYTTHLSKPCEATIILTLPALSDQKDSEGKFIQQEGYVDIKYFYTLDNTTTPSTYNKVADNNSLESDKQYYYYNSVLDKYMKIEGESLSSVLKVKDENGEYKEPDGDIKSGTAQTYYYSAKREYTYTIYLTIDYVKGPEISGNITVQNCALPGEMIRVSKENVKIESDASFAPDGYYWRLGKRVKNGDNWKFVDETTWEKTSTATGYDVFNEADEHGTKGLFYGANYVKAGNCVDIPAYYFMNGYGIQLGVTMTGFPNIFPVEMTEADQMVVHNYHRMQPQSSSVDVNFHLAEAVARVKAEPDFAQPRIYLSNQKDLAAFVAFIDTIGTGASTIADAASVTQPETIKLGSNQCEVPRYGAYAQFIVQNDLTIPTGYDPANYGNPIFAGTMHGEGHVVTGLAADKSLVTTNNGNIYNLGMASGKIASSNTSIGEGYSQGKYHCCFEYNDGSDAPRKVYRMDGTAVTSYTADDFRYGKVAYDLNQYYLTARQLVGSGVDLASVSSNSSVSSEIKTAMKYIHDYWANGDYQYARRNDDKTSEITGVTYLRTGSGTNEEPNYGSNLTRHNTSHTIDKPRAVGYVAAVGDTPESKTSYAPLFNATCNTPGAVSSDESLEINDYIYWGQNLLATPDAYPSTIASLLTSAMSNRVWRAVGYYGSTANGGTATLGTTPSAYHYNAFVSSTTPMATYVHIPTTTAIDFSCRADGTISSDSYKESGANCYYPPFSDLPSAYNSFAINSSSQITKNLLVYTAEDTEGVTNEAYDVVNTSLAYKETASEDKIHGHHIVLSGEVGTTQYLHLVERATSSAPNNDFCCPIAFDVTDRAWYTRKPPYYAEANNSAWEGICLPFTVNKVDASFNGEITHFFGDHTLHHEYWLRGLTTVTTADGTTTGTFQRPGSGLFSAGTTTTTMDYKYKNTFFPDTYSEYARHEDDKNSVGPVYSDNPTLEWYKSEHTFSDYYPLTQSIPYIVSFPGSRYYEFDLSSQHYNRLMGYTGSSNAAPEQTVTFNAYGSGYDETIAPNRAAVSIPVTAAVETPVTTYKHIGTYTEVAQSENVYSMNGSGTEFEKNSAPVLPFRTYMTTTSSSGAPTRGIIYIGTLEGDDAPEPTEPDPDDPDEPADPDLQTPRLDIYVMGRDLVVESNYATRLDLVTPTGARVRSLDVRPGRTVSPDLVPGVYIIHRLKVVVR